MPAAFELRLILLAPDTSTSAILLDALKMMSCIAFSPAVSARVAASPSRRSRMSCRAAQMQRPVEAAQPVKAGVAALAATLLLVGRAVRSTR
jgi:hypothetical protein